MEKLVLRRPSGAIGQKERADIERRLRESADVEAFLRRDRSLLVSSAEAPTETDKLSINKGDYLEDIMTHST